MAEIKEFECGTVYIINNKRYVFLGYDITSLEKILNSEIRVADIGYSVLTLLNDTERSEYLFYQGVYLVFYDYDKLNDKIVDRNVIICAYKTLRDLVKPNNIDKVISNIDTWILKGRMTSTANFLNYLFGTYNKVIDVLNNFNNQMKPYIKSDEEKLELSQSRFYPITDFYNTNFYVKLNRLYYFYHNHLYFIKYIKDRLDAIKSILMLNSTHEIDRIVREKRPVVMPKNTLGFSSLNSIMI